ncbi:(2Fe-2S)-binding protein [Aliishimia ponticola]
MRAADPMTIITPRKVYRALNKEADCGGCMSLFLDTMRQNDKLQVPMLRKPAVSGQPAALIEESGTCKATQRSSNI